MEFDRVGRLAVLGAPQLEADVASSSIACPKNRAFTKVRSKISEGKDMATEDATSLEARLLCLFREFGIKRAHIAARMDSDWQGFTAANGDCVASLSLLCPMTLDARAVAPMAPRLLVVAGDRGAAAERVRTASAAIGGAVSAILPNYEGVMWSDVVAERGTEISAIMLDFLRQTDLPPLRPTERVGEAAGISYHICGAGPPLLLMPLLLAPSQWAPIVPTLAEHYCTIELGGAFLGIVAMLEARGRSIYLGMIRTLLDAAQIRTGETVLDIGCGSGVVIREVARQTAGRNPLIGVDLSPYLLREAAQLARRDGRGEMIELREGRAEALPLADNSVDVALSCTVKEEGDAERMLGEMTRVTRPGGRIGVVVRAVDMHESVNLPLSAKAKVEAPGVFGAGVVPAGCADATLYDRFRAAGLTQLKLFPQLTAVTPDDPRFPMFEQQALAVLQDDEIAEWQRAVAKGKADGTLFVAMPHHCAVGTKS
jgi:SAM-dependent methyltransferase